MLIPLIYLISGWRWALFTSDVPLLGKTAEAKGDGEGEDTRRTACHGGSTLTCLSRAVCRGLQASVDPSRPSVTMQRRVYRSSPPGLCLSPPHLVPRRDLLCFLLAICLCI